MAKVCDLKKGGISILIRTDNRNATSTIPDAVSSMGYQAIVEKKEGYYDILINTPQKKNPAS